MLPSKSKVTFLLVNFGRIILSLLLARFTYFKFDELNPHKSLLDSNEVICEFFNDKDSKTGKSGKSLKKDLMYCFQNLKVPEIKISKRIIVGGELS